MTTPDLNPDLQALLDPSLEPRARAEGAEAERARLERALAEALREAAEARVQAEQAEAKSACVEHALARAIRERNAILSSNVWRFASSLRAAGNRVPFGIRHCLLATAKLAWWSATFKLPRKLREQAALRAIFDRKWYIATYPDVAAAGLDPLRHYLSSGASEGRDPGPSFSTRGYLIHNPDVAAMGINPLLHYVQFGRAEGRKATPVSSPARSYESWIRRHDTLTDADLADMRQRGAELRHRPKISILMPTYNTADEFLKQAIESVLAQTYDRWELCIADDASTCPEVHHILRHYENADPRIKVVYRQENGGISLASNSALELATGEWVALLDHDDVLAPHALFHVAAAIDANPDAQLIYSDEDKIDQAGQRYDPYFKPDFSLELFRSQNYLNHLTVYRTANVRGVGGWRVGLEGSQDYDLNLRIVENIDVTIICHIPHVLYHWRAVAGSTALAPGEKSYAYAAGLRALSDHVERLKLPARVERVEGVPYYRLRFEPPEPRPLVSIIIPTRDRVDLLRMCVGSILNKTTYGPFEVLIVDNGSVEAETRDYLAGLASNRQVRVLSYPHRFNYSAINNFAARAAQGEILALVNNDIEVISPDWLTEMAAWATQKEIGCVGAKLYYRNGSIQHAGVILGVGGVAGHSHKYFPRDHVGYFGRLKLAQTLCAVTGACLVVRKRVYLEVGGLNEEALPIAFNDIDLCLKVREAGYRNVWTPYAELYHHESVSRGHENTPEKRERALREARFMMQRWGSLVDSDPFYSPHLTREREDFSIRV